MIYRREEYIEESAEDSKFPLKRVEVLEAIEGGEKRFVGHLALGIMTPVGVQQVPISFEIEAATVQEAFQRFEEHGEPKIEETRQSLEKELEKLRQEASGRIVRPGEVGMGGKVIDFNRLKQ